MRPLHVAAILMAVAALIGGNAARAAYTPLASTMRAGVVCGLATGLVAVLALWLARGALGGTVGEWRALAGWSMAASLAVGVMGVTLLNGVGDRSPPREVVVEIARIEFKRTTLRVVEGEALHGATFWRSTRDLSAMRGGTTLHLGDRFTAVIRAGRLGYAWCESVR